MLIEQAKVDPGVRGSSHLAAGRPLALVFRRPRNLPTSSELTVVSTFVSTSEVLEGRLLAGRCPRRGAPPGAHPTRPAQCGAACSGISWRHRPACGADATGDLLPDAVIAAVAAEHSAEIVTLDRDFARFPSVPHRRPAGSRSS